MIDIIIEASDVWDYFQENKEWLQTHEKLIARCWEYGVDIWISGYGGIAEFTVEVDEEVVYDAQAITEVDCFETVSMIYDEYLSKATETLAGDYDEEDDEDEESLIKSREAELDDAVNYLLDILLCDREGFNTEIIGNASFPDTDEFKNRICELLFTEYGFDVYRPMYLECEDGSAYFAEHPYPEMELGN